MLSSELDCTSSRWLLLEAMKLLRCVFMLSELDWTLSRWLLALPTTASVKNSNVPESLSGLYRTIFRSGQVGSRSLHVLTLLPGDQRALSCATVSAFTKSFFGFTTTVIPSYPTRNRV